MQVSIDEPTRRHLLEKLAGDVNPHAAKLYDALLNPRTVAGQTRDDGRQERHYVRRMIAACKFAGWTFKQIEDSGNVEVYELTNPGPEPIWNHNTGDKLPTTEFGIVRYRSRRFVGASIDKQAPGYHTNQALSLVKMINYIYMHRAGVDTRDSIT